MECGGGGGVDVCGGDGCSLVVNDDGVRWRWRCVVVLCGGGGGGFDVGH